MTPMTFLRLLLIIFWSNFEKKLKKLSADVLFT